MDELARPVIGVSIGDPAGIGPEISIKALLDESIFDECKPILIGDISILREVNERLGLKADLEIIDEPGDARGIKGRIEVIDVKSITIKDITVGVASAASGGASIKYIERAVRYALRGDINAIATAPINKKAISMAGSRHIGHTELLAALCGVENPLTMFYVRGLRIFFLTRHVPLLEAIRAVKRERIIEATLRVNRALKWLGINKPRIAIAALNPHAGEDGLIGDEEIREIIPAIRELRCMGLDIIGPFPADSIFHQALERGYDAILSLYHDQGHIAAKTLDFYGAVAVTLGLPFIRTSVDHGTAYDIAWRGLASPKSLISAIKLAAGLSRVYNPGRE